MELIREGVKYPISEHWIQRWRFLFNYREVMKESGQDLTTIEWEYTDTTSVEEWIELNKAMDYYTRGDGDDIVVITDEENVVINNNPIRNSYGAIYNPMSDREQTLARPSDYQPFTYNGQTLSSKENPPSKRLIPLSSLYSIVDYMDPSNNRYLLYVYIDTDLTFANRMTAYRQLGEYVIENKLDPYEVERIGHFTKMSGWNKLRNALSAFIHADTSSITEEDQAVEYQAVHSLMRSDPLVDLFGILRSAAQFKPAPDSFFRLNWRDVERIVFDPEALAIHKEVEAIDSDENTPIRRFKKRFHTEVVMPDLEVRPLSVLFLAHVPIGRGRASLNAYSRAGTFGNKPLNIISRIHEPDYDLKVSVDKSHIYQLRLIKAAAIQANECDPHQLTYVAAFMLGLAPIIDIHLLDDEELMNASRQEQWPIPALLYARVLRCIASLGASSVRTDKFKRICRVLLRDLGSNYLKACTVCLLRLLEHNDKLKTIRDADVISIHKSPAPVKYAYEKQNMVLIAEAMLALLTK